MNATGVEPGGNQSTATVDSKQPTRVSAGIKFSIHVALLVLLVGVRDGGVVSVDTTGGTCQRCGS